MTKTVIRHGREIRCDGAQLRRMRDAVRMSLADIATLCEESRQTVHAWETGRSVPGDLSIHLLGDLYGQDALRTAVQITQVDGP